MRRQFRGSIKQARSPENHDAIFHRHARLHGNARDGLSSGFQIAMLKLVDQPEALAAAESRQARRRKQLRERTSAMESLSMDDPFWHEFFSAFVNEGEAAAHELAARQAAERSPDVTGN